MHTLIEDKVMRVFYATVGHHGYWFVNHAETIREDVQKAIDTKGWRKVIEMLEEDYRKSEFIKKLYKKIENA